MEPSEAYAQLWDWRREDLAMEEEKEKWRREKDERRERKEGGGRRRGGMKSRPTGSGRRGFGGGEGGEMGKYLNFLKWVR
jgi:hypothetical protein